ncbi:MAG: hypothetical protein P8N43_02420, partial [Alphaproteobacteria bacterium]|nr:hypothetical protein [Alphaproteobacteria bacterium]
VGSIVPFLDNPSISMSYSCGMFNRSRMSQKTMMHPRRATKRSNIQAVGLGACPDECAFVNSNTKSSSSFLGPGRNPRE